MIRTYSDPVIALEKETAILGADTKLTIVTAEAEINGQRKEVRIHFYGSLAEEVARIVVPGLKFAFRGQIEIEDGALNLVGRTFSPIP